RLVRFVPGDVEGQKISFWDRAEELVRKALDDFVGFATNGGRLRRELFAEDAKQGLGFVDLLRCRFDVVLMNPPFGSPSKPAKAYLSKRYPCSKTDMYSMFVNRGIDQLEDAGQLGAITSRTGFFLTSFSKWREEVLLAKATPTTFLDLGKGVLDT